MIPKKILVVDDVPAMVDLLCVHLTKAGYTACSAGDGLEALEKVESENPDLIIMDVLMPKMTGFEALQRLREDPKWRDLPVIVISGRDNLKEFFQDISGVEFLPKPYDSKELLAKIEHLTRDKTGT
ncbi:MAG: response regulator [Candidatus Omnitrophota bacterium]